MCAKRRTRTRAAAQVIRLSDDGEKPQPYNAELVTAVRGSLELIHDVRTLEEMLTFVRNEDYRPEAEAGAHDDLIMSLAIANHVRPMQRRVADVRRGRRSGGRRTCGKIGAALRRMRRSICSRGGAIRAYGDKRKR